MLGGSFLSHFYNKNIKDHGSYIYWELNLSDIVNRFAVISCENFKIMGILLSIVAVSLRIVLQTKCSNTVKFMILLEKSVYPREKYVFLDAKSVILWAFVWNLWFRNYTAAIFYSVGCKYRLKIVKIWTSKFSFTHKF